MARSGRVSAGEVGTDDWYRLSVFDDGWVDLPGFARSLSDTRSNLRRSLVNLGVIVVALIAVWGLSALAGTHSGGSAIALSIAGVVLLVAAVGYVAVQTFRMRSKDLRQGRADYLQARRFRDSGRRVRMAPGAPRWRRATSAEQLAGWLTGVRLTRASDVASVILAEDDGDQLAHITFHDGSTRTYRSPDAKLRTLLGPFAGPGPVHGAGSTGS